MVVSRAVFITLLSLLLNVKVMQAQNSAGASATPRRQADKASLKGMITDGRTGEALDGASLYFSDLKKGTVSNMQGNYSIRNLPQGRYIVEVSHLGYASIVSHILFNGEMERNFSLSSSVVENEAVTVTGVSSASSVRKSPVPVDILKRQDLLRTASTNLIDALSKTPGVSQITSGPAISKPSIRGLGYNRLVVVNDGVKQEGQQWGDEHGIEIDEYSVNRAEVLKGPASIMYGSDALAGVVNILTNVPVAEGIIKGNVFTNYQTNNGLLGFNGNLAGNIKGLNWNIYGTHKSAIDYMNMRDGRVFNSKFNEKDMGGYIGINKSWGYTHLMISNFNQHLGLIEGEREDRTGKFLKYINSRGIAEQVIATGKDFESRDPFLPRQDIQHFKISSDNSFRTANGRITLNIGFQRNQRKEFGNVLDPSEKELHFDLKTITYNVQYHFPQNKNWETTIGVNGMQQENTNKGVEALIPGYRLFDAGAFLYAKKSFDKLTISGGLRADNRLLHSKRLVKANETKFEDFRKNFSNVSGSAGISYEAGTNLILKVNIARGFRAPSIPELSSNGAHEGTNRYEYGEKSLKSETSIQIDGGMELNSEHVSLSASLFYNSISHFIYYRKLSSVLGGDSVINENGNLTTAFRFDQENAKLYGAEFNLDIHPHPLDWLHIENTFSYVRGVMSQPQDGSKNLPFIPSPRLLTDLRGDFFKKGKRIRNAYVNFELDNTLSQNHPFTGYDTETRTPGYTLLNAGMGTEFVIKSKTLFSIYIAANNMADVSYQNHLSRLKYAANNTATGRMGVYNMGRSFSVKINIPLIFSAASQ